LLSLRLLRRAVHQRNEIM